MWTPKEVRKLLILLTGIGLEISGVFLLVNQIQATGNIDISSSLISGKIQSGNAGLLLCFIGLFVMALSIIGGKDTIHYNTNLSAKTGETDAIVTINHSEKRGLVVIVVLGLLTLALIFGGTYLNKIKWEAGIILIVFGVLTAIVEGIMIISFIDSYLDTKQTEEPKEKVEN
jgi:hypothetical protein